MVNTSEKSVSSCTGRLPKNVPATEHFVFTMTEGIAETVVRLYGVCVRSHEVVSSY